MPPLRSMGHGTCQHRRERALSAALSGQQLQLRIVIPCLLLHCSKTMVHRLKKNFMLVELLIPFSSLAGLEVISPIPRLSVAYHEILRCTYNNKI